MAEIMLGDIDLEAVVNEEPTLSGETTDKPVEKGSDISDHFKSNPTTISLSGSVVGLDAPRKLATLRNYKNNAELIRYTGRNVFDNMQITSLSTKHNANNRTGFDFDVILKQVKVAMPKTFEAKVANPVTKKQDKKTATKVKTPTSTGRQQPKVKQVSPPSPGPKIIPKPNTRLSTREVTNLFKQDTKPGGQMQMIRRVYPVKKPTINYYKGGLS